MIGTKMRDAMNEQIKYEFESSYLYLGMAAYFHGVGFDGMAHWMRAQAIEEMVHAMKFYDHIYEREGAVELASIEPPKKKWNSPLEVFRETLKHEQFVTSRIHLLAKIAQEENDYAASVLLHWFINEQVEEESSAQKAIQKLERVGDFGYGLQMLDAELGARPVNWALVQGMVPGAGGQVAGGTQP